MNDNRESDLISLWKSELYSLSVYGRDKACKLHEDIDEYRPGQDRP